MTRPSKLWACGAMVALCLCAGGARADEAGDQARARYERALSLYEEGVYDAALVELRRAYDLRPTYKLLYNIGQVRVAMKDYAGALETFQQYLREGASKVPSARRAAVEKDIASLEQRVGRLTLAVDLDGAELFVDDAAVGTSPLKRDVIVSSGVRRVTARHPDHPAQTVRVSIAGGERQEVALRVGERAVEPAARAATSPPAKQPEPAPLPAPQHAVAPLEPAPKPIAPARRRSILPWIGWSTTGALGLTAAGLGVGAQLKSSALKEARRDIGDNAARKQTELEDLKGKARAFAIATDVLIGATAVAAGVSLWLTLRAPRDRDAPPRATALRLGPSSVSLRTEF
ncbi:MAG: hypothetical protein ABW252_20200 [Polyangiales bacterium]